MNFKHHLAGILLLAATLTAGCKSNLQQPYVESMQATHAAVMADVEAARYKPTALKAQVLQAWGKANADAEAAMRSEGEWKDKAPEPVVAPPKAVLPAGAQ